MRVFSCAHLTPWLRPDSTASEQRFVRTWTPVAPSPLAGRAGEGVERWYTLPITPPWCFARTTALRTGNFGLPVLAWSLPIKGRGPDVFLLRRFACQLLNKLLRQGAAPHATTPTATASPAQSAQSTPIFPAQHRASSIRHPPPCIIPPRTAPHSAQHRPTSRRRVTPPRATAA